MVAALTLDFCEVSIYDDHIVVVVNEGELVTPDSNSYLKEIASQYFPNRLFGYISLRKHQYSVDPSTYLDTSKIENIVAFAVVSHEGIGINNVEVEKRFFTKPFKHFLKLSDARSWLRELTSITS
ncbi:MAG: hypothetical protein ABJM06_08075 [Gilvibacter sp.]